MTREDIDFLKSMVFQGADMTERQERRAHRIIDDMRMLVSESAELSTLKAELAAEREHEREILAELSKVGQILFNASQSAPEINQAYHGVYAMNKKLIAYFNQARNTKEI
jgi:hypothetical protein